MLKNLSRRKFLIQSAQASAAISVTGLSKPLRATNEIPKGDRKITVFSKHLHWLEYDEMAKTTAQLGFDGVDLTVRPRGHVLPENVQTNLPKAVEACKKANIEVVMLTTAINSVDSPNAKEVLKTAGELGIGFYRLGWINYDLKISIKRNLKKIQTQLQKLAELNEKYHIKGGYQNHAGANLGSAVWDIAFLLEAINSEWLGCQYDIRHATLEGANCWPTGLQYIAPHINTIDIKDFHWAEKEGKWQHNNVPLGNGIVDFDKYFGMLKQLDVNAPISIHFEYPLGGAERGSKKLTVKTDVVTNAMKKDLNWLTTKLDQYDL